MRYVGPSNQRSSLSPQPRRYGTKEDLESSLLELRAIEDEEEQLRPYLGGISVESEFNLPQLRLDPVSAVFLTEGITEKDVHASKMDSEERKTISSLSGSVTAKSRSKIRFDSVLAKMHSTRRERLTPVAEGRERKHLQRDESIAQAVSGLAPSAGPCSPTASHSHIEEAHEAESAGEQSAGASPKAHRQSPVAADERTAETERPVRVQMKEPRAPRMPHLTINVRHGACERFVEGLVADGDAEVRGGRREHDQGVDADALADEPLGVLEGGLLRGHRRAAQHQRDRQDLRHGGQAQDALARGLRQVSAAEGRCVG